MLWPETPINSLYLQLDHLHEVSSNLHPDLPPQTRVQLPSPLSVSRRRLPRLPRCPSRCSRAFPPGGGNHTTEGTCSEWGPQQHHPRPVSVIHLRGDLGQCGALFLSAALYDSRLLQNRKLSATPRLTIAFVVPRSRRLLPAVGGRSRRHSVVCASWCCAPWQREQTHTPVPLFALRPTTRLDPPRTPSHLPFKLTRRLRSPLVPRYVCPFAAFLRAKRTALLNFRERRGNVFVIKDT